MSTRSRRWLLAASLLLVTSVSASSRCPLRVVLYPYVPDKTGYFYLLEQSFEASNPDIDLQIVDLSADYYDEDQADSLPKTNADVFELDSVFLDDFIKVGKVKMLSA